MAERGGGGLKPLDVSVVVRAQHGDEMACSTIELVGMRGDVRREIRGAAIAAGQHAILVVAERGRTQPGCAGLLVRLSEIDEVLRRLPALVADVRTPLSV